MDDGGITGTMPGARNVGPEAIAIAVAANDVVHVARRCIAPVYLMDAVGEAALLVAWGIRRRRALAGTRSAGARECTRASSSR